jgi:alpha-L-rhamnosidase
MAGWVNFMRRRAGDNYIWRNDFQFGDWLDYRGEDARNPNPVTNRELIATAFFAHSADLLAKAADVLGCTSDARLYADLADQVKRAFVNEFVTHSGRIGPNTQKAYLLTLHFDILQDDLRPAADERLVDEIRLGYYHLTTGFVGTPYLCLVLSRYGYSDVAYDLLNQENYPSWLYPVKLGATTIWERWDGIKPDGIFQDAKMNSFNHYAYGAIGDWLYQVVAGIKVDPDKPGYKRVIIQPKPGGGLTSARGDFDSMYGRIESNWNLNKDKFNLTVTIPANTEGEVYLPAQSMADITEQGQALDRIMGIRDIWQEEANVILTLGSGTYHFSTRMH